MAKWCHFFDFPLNGQGWSLTWPSRPNYGTYVSGSGWKTIRINNADRIYIWNTLAQRSRITRIRFTYTATGTSPSTALLVTGYRDGSHVNTYYGPAITDGVPHVHEWNGSAEYDAIGCHIILTPGTGYIRSAEVEGEGIDPFGTGDDPTVTQNALDSALIAVRDALQANPTVYPQAEFDAYKTAIQGAFGVTFENESGAQEWGSPDVGGIALHFARLGLEAVTKAIEQWFETEIEQQSLCELVNRYDLFKRVMGSVRFRNVATEQDYPAENAVIASERVIVVYRRPAGGQWCMTPNNVIHELGHWFGNSSGFNFNKIGSLEYTITDPSKGGGNALHEGFSRKGMAEGRLYLRAEFLEHAVISDSNSDNIPEYTPLPGKLPAVSDPEYGEFVPSRYLFYGVADNLFNVWRSPVYHDRYGDNARIDTLVQNDTADQTETAADGFLNWVRDQEYLREYASVRSRRPFYDAVGETQAATWIAFFTSNIGMFLRNAVIYNYPGGMVQFYKDQGVIPPTSITPGTRIDDAANVRLTPDAGTTDNLIGTTGNYLNSNLEIYGWTDATSSGTSPYWLLIVDKSNRLVWVASGAIQHISADITPENEIPDSQLALMSPSRSFDANDLSILLGE